MTKEQLSQLGKTLWAIADDLRGAMNADDFRDYMLSFLFLRYLSDNYEAAAKKELGRDYPKMKDDDRRAPLAVWYANNAEDVPAFEKQLRRKMHYVIHPDYLWSSIAELARTQKSELLQTLERGFKYNARSISSSMVARITAGKATTIMPAKINMAQPKIGSLSSDIPGGRVRSVPTMISIAPAMAEISIKPIPSNQKSALSPGENSIKVSGGYINQPPLGARS